MTNNDDYYLALFRLEALGLVRIWHDEKGEMLICLTDTGIEHRKNGGVL